MSGKRKSSGGASAGDGSLAEFELSKYRRVSVSRFKGKVLVGIREMYEHKETGEMRFGKTGISLNLEQFAKLRKAMDSIAFAIEAAGEKLPEVSDVQELGAASSSSSSSSSLSAAAAGAAGGKKQRTEEDPQSEEGDDALGL